MKKELCSVLSVSADDNSFNPCSNGMKKELQRAPKVMGELSFNPCSNGMKKELVAGISIAIGWMVLILVLME